MKGKKSNPWEKTHCFSHEWMNKSILDDMIIMQEEQSMVKYNSGWHAQYKWLRCPNRHNLTFSITWFIFIFLKI